MPSQTTGSGFPMLDAMLSMQRISAEMGENFQRTMMTSLGRSFDQMLSIQRSLMTIPSRRESRALVPFQTQSQQSQQSQQVIGYGEEVLNVSTRRIPGQVTRVRRVVTHRPVEQDVQLRDEMVVVERRPANGKITGEDALAERDYEMQDTTEIPVVSKEFHPLGEMVLRKNVNERTEHIKDTIARSEVKVMEEPQRASPIIRPDQPEVKPTETNNEIITG